MIPNNTISIQKIEVERPEFLLSIEGIELRSGDIVGIVGTNGSGKTSFIEAMLGLLPSSKVDMHIIQDGNSMTMACPSDRIAVGSQIQNSSFPDDIKVRDIVKLHGLLYGKSKNDLYSKLQIADLANKSFVKCSLGEKRRVELYFACAHNPVFLFLDEPTSNLDDHFSVEVVCWLRSRAVEGAIIFVCTHSAKEVGLCKQLIWLSNGEQKYFGPKTDFIKNHLSTHKLKLKQDAAQAYSSQLMAASVFIDHKGEFDIYYGNSDLESLAADMMSSASKDTGISISKTDEHDILQYTSGTRYVC